MIEFELGKFLSPEEYRACREFRQGDLVNDALYAYATRVDLEDSSEEGDEEGF